MPKITFVEHGGARHEVEAREGASVMQAAVENMVPGILADCGGTCSCATCHAYVAPEWNGKLAPPSEDESIMLDGVLDQRATSRLTCQVKACSSLDGIVFQLPEHQF